MRSVFPAMGTMVSLVTERAVAADAVAAVFDAADRRFSLYRPDSELRRIAAGRLRLEESSPAMKAMYADALEWRQRTEGAFSPNRPDGVIDLDGIVKAAAMRDAGDVLDASDCGAWTLVVGGDILASGADPGAGARDAIGVVDPFDRGALVCSIMLRGRRRAVATSGSAERGDHIWLGGQTAPADFVQVTVIADDIVTADVLATAIVSAGRAGLDDLCDRWPIDVFAVDRAGRSVATPGFRAALAPAGGRRPRQRPGRQVATQLGA
ncbi:FAD:protein FMN transferase [Pseudolysinimonas sp.]|jgi:thiamine biosynthesis lipoprotein|uniref:FAD:protein FMN transferase n=1 Tax=Pseudolysinimonas sp. TaxID=2680009 RepID=UPI0037840190